MPALSAPPIFPIHDLLNWFEKTMRPLPWREEPRDPYRVWISEIMLQQTQVKTVIPYFNRWMDRLPAIHNVAQASRDDLLKLWEGLGYYRRVINIHRCAMKVMEAHGGVLPSDPADLKMLPGIGDYTAAAIASLAFGADSLAVDGNVRRVMARFFILSRPPTPRTIQDVLEGSVPSGHFGHFNEALMELGATLCTTRNPSCDSCPLSEGCLALESGCAGEYPQTKKSRSVPHVSANALVWTQGDKIFLVKRDEEGMLAGLYGFPLSREIEETGTATVLDEVRHAYSHFIITARPILMQEDAEPYGDTLPGRWIPIGEIENIALSTLDHKILERIKPFVEKSVSSSSYA